MTASFQRPLILDPRSLVDLRTSILKCSLANVKSMFNVQRSMFNELTLGGI